MEELCQQLRELGSPVEAVEKLQSVMEDRFDAVDSKLDVGFAQLDHQIEENFQRIMDNMNSKGGAKGPLPDYAIPSDGLEYGEVLGAGGFGEVAKATWNFTEVAVKRLHGHKLPEGVLRDMASPFTAPSATPRELERAGS
jgi:hypothetical protein